eukprot:SAG22_NODE_14511_length_373_cov_0.441606_1_plen_47_part_10
MLWVDVVAQIDEMAEQVKAVITAFPSVSLPFLAVPLRSHGPDEQVGG